MDDGQPDILFQPFRIGALSIKNRLLRSSNREVDIPVLCTGGFQTPTVIRQAIERGDCEAVTIARPLLANPDLPKDARLASQGGNRDYRAPVPCTCCNKCTANVLEHPLGCYEGSRFESYEAMMDHVLSFFEEGPEYTPSCFNGSFPGIMTENPYPFWKKVFRFKAGYNILVSIAFAILLALWPKALDYELIKAPAGASVLFYLLLAHSFVFGLGFWRVSRNVTKNRDIVIMGLCAQLLVCLIASAYTWTGALGLLLGGGIAGMDLVFALLFLIFLSRQKTAAAAVGER